MSLAVTERMMRYKATTQRDHVLKKKAKDGSQSSPSPYSPHLLFSNGPVHPGLASFPKLAHDTCSLELPGPGYSQAPPNSDRPFELPGLHGQTVWAPPVLAVQLGCWGQRHQPDMQPGEREV